MSQERRPLVMAELEQLREWVGTIQGPPPDLCLTEECRARLEALPRWTPAPPPPAPDRPRQRRRRGLSWLLMVLGLLAVLGIAAG